MKNNFLIAKVSNKNTFLQKETVNAYKKNNLFQQQ